MTPSMRVTMCGPIVTCTAATTSVRFPSTKPAAGDTASMLPAMPPCWWPTGISRWPNNSSSTHYQGLTARSSVYSTTRHRVATGDSHCRATYSTRGLNVATRRTDHAAVHAGVHAGWVAPLSSERRPTWSSGRSRWNWPWQRGLAISHQPSLTM